MVSMGRFPTAGDAAARPPVLKDSNEAHAAGTEGSTINAGAGGLDVRVDFEVRIIE